MNKIPRKRVFCGFCQGFTLSGNTFVGNCFLRISVATGKSIKSSSDIWPIGKYRQYIWFISSELYGDK